MGPTASTTVAVLQGNATVANLMHKFLDNSASFEVEFLRGLPPGAARAQLAIIDIDSGLEEAQRWIRHCDGRQLPVIVCGVESSRSAYSDRPWLSRPFGDQELKNLCLEVLGMASDRPADDEIPPPIEVNPSEEAPPTVELPGDMAESSGGDPRDSGPREPINRETTDELIDVIDMDGTGSMILEIEDLADGEEVGGMLVGSGNRRRFGDDELDEVNPWADEPDTQVEVEQQPRATASPTGDKKTSGTAPSVRAEVTAVSSVGDMVSGDFSSAHQVASLVAEHWDRLGLTARPADRADRLQRVLTAMMRDGIDGVLDELKRIPPGAGFSGCLETLSVVDLLHTVRDRGLRGRLEVGLNGHSFVLYIDGTTLHAIDSLGENTDGLLLKILSKMNAIDADEHQHYTRLVGEQRGEPVEMQIRRDGSVDERTLLAAKRERAKRLLAELCHGERGTFAFIEIAHDGGQTWPNRGLSLHIDALVLEILRESSVDDSAGPGTRSELVLDSERASRLAPEALTEGERKMLEFFREGRSIDSARDIIGDDGESVDRIVDRLRRLELLRRLGNNAPETDSADKYPEISDDPHEGPTAVNASWDLEVLDEVSGGDETTPEGWPDPLEAGAEEETQEDVGFSAGVPDEFVPDSRRPSHSATDPDTKDE